MTSDGVRVVVSLVAFLPFLGGVSCDSARLPDESSASLQQPLSASSAAFAEVQDLYRRNAESRLAGLSAVDRARIESDWRARAQPRYALPIRWTVAGTPRYLLAPEFAILPGDLGLPGSAAPVDVADAFIRRFSALWRVDSEALAEVQRRVYEHPGRFTDDIVSVEYQQFYAGLLVSSSIMTVHVRKSDHSVAAVVGSFAPVPAMSTVPTVSADAARDAVALEPGQAADAGKLVIWSGHMAGDPRPPRLAWEFLVEEGAFANRRAWVDAQAGDVLGTRELDAYELKRSLWDRQDLSGSLPGCAATEGYDDATCTYWRRSAPGGICTENEVCMGCPGVDPRAIASKPV